MNKQKKSVITTDFNVLTKKLFHKKSKKNPNHTKKIH